MSLYQPDVARPVQLYGATFRLGLMPVLEIFNTRNCNERVNTERNGLHLRRDLIPVD